MNTAQEFTSLTSLLESSQKMEAPTAGVARGVYSTPGSIGPPKRSLIATQNIKTEKPKNNSDIWQEDEVQEYDQDPRKQPEYKISYVQRVRSEDMFLGMAGKTPSLSHSDGLEVIVSLPGAAFKDISLQITSTRVEVMTEEFKLDLYLPNTVNEKDGNAKWNASTSELALSLPIVHQFPL